MTAKEPAHRVYIGIGSNLDRPMERVRAALEHLRRAPRVERLEASPLYRCKPWGNPDQPEYVNGAARIETRLSAQQALALCLETERIMGRRRGACWGPRIIDLDLLLYEDLVIDQPDFKLPHPYLTQRDFVLRPLLDLDAQLRHPLTRLELRSYLERRELERTILEKIDN